MALFNKDGVIKETIGTTVLVKMENVYLGDGDGYTHGVGIALVNGEYKRFECGTSNWYGYDCDLLGSVVDGDVAAYEDHLAEVKRMHNIREANYEAYELAKGRLAIVRSGPRKRKNAGRSGRIFWFGSTQYGYSVGIEEESGERFFVAASQVAVVPEPEELMEIGG